MTRIPIVHNEDYFEFLFNEEGKLETVQLYASQSQKPIETEWTDVPIIVRRKLLERMKQK